MSSTEQPSEVTAYLRQLDGALADVDAVTANEIREGIAEELTSLAPEDARLRITQLGDPAFIAAQARADTDRTASSVERSHIEAPKSGLRSRWYIILASVAVIIGGYIVPVIGWILGYILVCISPAWRRWEKIVAIATPMAASLLVAGYFTILELQDRAATNGAYNEPVLPLPVTATWNMLIALVVATAAVGIWLLIRAIRRA